MSQFTPDPLTPAAGRFLVPWRTIIVGAVIWCGLLGFFTLQFHFSTSTTWDTSWNRTVRDWIPWVILTPVVFFLSNHFRLGRRRWPLNLPVHIFASVACVFIAEALVISILPSPLPGSDPHRRDKGARPEGAPPPSFDREPSSQRPPSDPEAPPQGEFDQPPPERRPPGDDLRPLPQHRADPRGNPPGFVANVFRKMQLWLPVYWVLASIAHALNFYRRLEDRERRALTLEKRLAEAHLDTLKNQLEPHFLFNALNAIATLVHTDPDRTDTMIVGLSTLLRRFLDTGNTQVIPISEELGFLRAYLDIEKIRFGERLQVTEDIAEDSLKGNLPVMLLQPLAENAVRHGIEPLGRPGTLTVFIRRIGDRLFIQLTDDGVGLKNDPGNGSKSEPVPSASRGIGVTNARSRLEALYGAGGFTLSIAPNPDGGTTVSLDIPYSESDLQSPDPK